MPERMRLTVSGTTIDFSPLLTPEYDRPDDRDRRFFQADDAGRWYSDYGRKQDHVIALNNVQKTRADQLNTWWQGRTLLTFTPDLVGTPGTTIFVRILNEQRPIQMSFQRGWQAQYKGTLELHEVSSSSSA